MLHFLPLLGGQYDPEFQRELRNRSGRLLTGGSQAVDRVICLGLIHRLFIESGREIGIGFIDGLMHFPHVRTKIPADLQDLLLLLLTQVGVLRKIAVPPRPRSAHTRLPRGSPVGSPGSARGLTTRGLTGCLARGLSGLSGLTGLTGLTKKLLRA
jgi:hypothetical protein